MRRSPTSGEAALWARLRNSQLGLKFRRQHPLGPFIADFYCYASRLVVEVDGPIHASAGDADVAREDYFKEHGVRAIRFSNESVNTSIDSVLNG